MKWIMLITVLLCAGCTSEGNSIGLLKGETRYFVSMDDCKKEAFSEYENGGKKYSNYECRSMLLGIFQLESINY